jgi:hypothetical protein
VQSDQWEWFEKSVEEAEWVKYVNAIRIEVSAKSAAVRGGRGRSASWHFNFKPKGGQAFRFSVDSEAGKHIEAKGDAEALADNWRSAIRAGTFRRSHETESAATAPASDVVTLAKFGETYATRLGQPVSRNHQTCFNQFAASIARGTEMAYGARPLSAITEDDIEVFFAHLTERDVAQSTKNKYVQMVKATFRWAKKKGYLERPIG